MSREERYLRRRIRQARNRLIKEAEKAYVLGHFRRQAEAKRIASELNQYLIKGTKEYMDIKYIQYI